MSLVSPLKSSLFANGSEFYEISDEYDASVSGFAGDYEYFGYLNNKGKWIIQRHQITTGTYRYISGISDYATNWSGKGGLNYDYWNTLLNTVP